MPWRRRNAIDFIRQADSSFCSVVDFIKPSLYFSKSIQVITNKKDLIRCIGWYRFTKINSASTRRDGETIKKGSEFQNASENLRKMICDL